MIRLHVDEPVEGAVLDRPGVVLRGWIADEGPIDGVEVRVGDAATMAEVEARPDVEAALPDAFTHGFRASVQVRPSVEIVLAWWTDGVERTRTVEVGVDAAAIDSFWRRKARKLERIRPHLRCSRCGGLLDDCRDSGLRCRSCEVRFGRDDGRFELIGDVEAAHAGVVPTQNVSSHPYVPEVRDLLERQRGGLLLDAGAGLRPDYLDDVVNLDVVAYDSTDVLAIGERLPFADGTFDGVVSIAVLEHVRHPFEAARELVRVLKPGGEAVVMVPFLQPYHGYPDHYFNMTTSGVVQLFPEMEVTSQEVTIEGAPIHTLTWFLAEWDRGLPPEAAADFRELRVGDLLGDAHEYLAANWVTQLSREAAHVVASATTTCFRKPEP